MAYFSSYTAGKFGVFGLTLTLHQELRGTGIHACAVLPASIETTIFQHAGNYTSRALKAMSPISNVNQVARTILAQAERPGRIVVVGRSARLLSRFSALAPALADRFVTWMIESQHWRTVPEPPTSGNLFEPVPEWTDGSGGWKDRRRPIARRAPQLAGTPRKA